MDNTTLNLDFLKRLGACKQGIEFVEQFSLQYYPINKLNSINGDLLVFKAWLIDKIQDMTFDNKGNIKSTNKSNYSYDDNNNLIEIYHSNNPNIKQTHTYDKHNNMLTHNTKWFNITYSYDNDHNIKSLIQDGHTSTFTYDDNNNRILTNIEDKFYIYNTYNKHNQLLTSINSKNNIRQYTYNDNGNIKTFSHNTNPKYHNYINSYDDNNNLLSHIRSNGRGYKVKRDDNYITFNGEDDSHRMTIDKRLSLR